MHRTTSIDMSAKPRSRLSHIALVVGIVCLTIMGMIGSSPAVYADGPGGNVSDPFTRMVDIAKPSIVRIITVINGHLTVHFPNSQNVTFPQNDPRGYPLGLSGTGAFITAHGDILTADHVINPPHDSSLDQYLDQTAAPDVANYYNQNVNPRSTLSSDQVSQALMNGQLPSTTQYDSPTSEVYLSTDFTGPLTATNAQSLPGFVHSPVDRIEKQSSFNDRDVAIIHVSNMDDMASAQIGDSSTVSEQDELRIVGFPGNGDVNMNNISQLLTSSVNQVFVSSIKTTNSGAPVIQVGGNVEHGDSGAPALNSNGKIVGIVSFGANGPGSTSFLQASASALTLVQSLSLDTTPGPFEKAWTQAFTDYASTTPGHWHKAQQEFSQIAAHYNNFKAITPYLTYTTQQAKSEKVPQSQPSTQPTPPPGSPVSHIPAYIWAVVPAVVVLLAILLFGGIALQRRKGRHAAATGSAATEQAFNLAPPIGSTGSGQSGPYGQKNSMPPMQGRYAAQQNDTMTAFGAPNAPPSAPTWPNSGPQQPVPGTFQSQTMPNSQTWISPRSPVQPNAMSNPAFPANNSGALVPWPCGHMNRPIARYCSVCGEPAPSSPTIRKYEQ